MKKYINEKRILDEFIELTSIDSVSMEERKMADVLKSKLEGLGFEVTEDNAGEYYGNGEKGAGNIYAFLKGRITGLPVMFSAHMDTVAPGYGKKAIVDGDIIHTDESTVLGADDVTGITEILEAVRVIKENGLPHRDIEVVFSIGEELYDRGTNAFNYSKLRCNKCYVLDMSGPAGKAAYKAPSIVSFKLEITGKAAHAGFEYEKGVNAIATAAEIIASVPQGYLDEETSLNIGKIEGGQATNIVSDKCTCIGEVRSFNHDKAIAAIKNLGDIAAEICGEKGASCEVSYVVNVHAYESEKEGYAAADFIEACRKEGIEGEMITTFGGSDNNNFAEYGIDGIVLSCGMENVHSTKEYAVLSEMVKTAGIVARLMTM